MLKYTNTICDKSKGILQHFSDPSQTAVESPQMRVQLTSVPEKLKSKEFVY